MPRLALSLLGAFQASMDGKAVTGFDSDKVRALLAYLAVESGQAHRRETLTGLFWPERTERVARQNLSQALSNLRRVLGEREAAQPFLLATRQTVRFAPTSDHELDVDEFIALLDLCSQSPDGSSECHYLDQALELRRGEFLQGFSLPGCPAFEEWMLLQQERFHGLTTEALQRLVGFYHQSNAWEQALRYGRQWVALEPWREDAHRQVMQMLALSGQRNAALAQYESCARIVREELGVEPDQETRTLYQRICDGRSPAVTAESAPSNNLPASLMPLLGREKDVHELVACLQGNDCRLLTVVGPGGIGKTHLALEAARQLYREEGGLFADGIYFVSLASLRAIEALVPAIGQAIDFSFYQATSPRQQLLHYLGSKQMLLVLDNFEHLIAGTDLVLEILRSAPGVKALVTSRARLNLQSEHLWPLHGIESPAQASAPLQSLQSSPAVRLFVLGARRVRPGFEPSEGEWRTISRICRQVQGMPLAILLAAAWIGVLSTDEIHAQLSSQDLDFLTTDWQDVPQRQRSMRAVFAYSWRQLGARQQELLQGLSVFRGSFTRQAAEKIAGATLLELLALVRRSTLRTSSTGRYEMHELMRRYGAEKLDQSPDLARRVRERHCAHYVGALERWAERLKGTEWQATLAEMDGEVDNARAAWEWAVSSSDWEGLGRALEGLCSFYLQRARYAEGEAACRLAIEALAKTPDGGELESRVLAWMGGLVQMMGRYDEALECYARARAFLTPRLCETPEHRSRFADLCGKAASVYEKQSSYAAALKLLDGGLAALEGAPTLEAARIYLTGAGIHHRQGNYTQSLEWWQQGSDVLDIGGSQDRECLQIRAHAAYLRAAIHQRCGEFERTIELCHRSLVLYDRLGNLPGAGSAHNNLATAYFRVGDWERAIEHYLMAMEIRTRIGDVYECGVVSNNLGDLCTHRGDLDQATRYLRQSLAIWRQVNSTLGLALVHSNLAAVALRRGDSGEALALLQESLKLFEQIGSRDNLPEVYWRIAKAWLTRSDLDAALGYARRSVALAQDQGTPQEEAIARKVLGQVYLAQHRWELAERELGVSREMLAGMGIRYRLGQTLIQLGRLYRAQERYAEAVAALDEAIAILSALGARPDLEQAKALRRDLPAR